MSAHIFFSIHVHVHLFLFLFCSSCFLAGVRCSYTLSDVYLLFLVSGSKPGAGPYDDSIEPLDLSLSPPAPRVHSTKPGGTAKGKFNFRYVCSVHIYAAFLE